MAVESLLWTTPIARHEVGVELTENTILLSQKLQVVYIAQELRLQWFGPHSTVQFPGSGFE